MPLILPSPKLMAKWLPAVRWGSLEYDRSTASGIPMCMVALEQGKQGHKRQAPWMNQSSLAAALEEQALGWIGATDYYRLPHVLHFDSVASIGTLLQQSLLRETSWRMKIWSRRIRAHSVAFYQHVLVHLFGGQSLEKSLLRQNGAEATTWHAWSGDSWHQLPQGGTCRDGFITQEDFPQAPCCKCHTRGPSLFFDCLPLPKVLQIVNGQQLAPPFTHSELLPQDSQRAATVGLLLALPRCYCAC